MAVALEFISLIVPIETINKYYKGGFAQYKIDYSTLIGGRVWYDNYLVRDGAMSPMDMQMMVDEWQSLGVKTISKDGDNSYWDELCVVDYFGGVTLDCDWLVSIDGAVKHVNDTTDVVFDRNNVDIE